LTAQGEIARYGRSRPAKRFPPLPGAVYPVGQIAALRLFHEQGDNMKIQIAGF